MPDAHAVTVNVDRIEGDKAVLIAGENEVVMPISWLPEGVGEGAVLTLSFTADPESQAALEATVKDHLSRRQTGDIEL